LVEAVVQRLGAKPAASVDDLLAAGINGVLIAAATDVHPELILATLPPPCPCTTIALIRMDEIRKKELQA
jgi:myo-inositol 2-dehydrogenase/D-chiro-inositol 1-dehydrogenase